MGFLFWLDNTFIDFARGHVAEESMVSVPGPATELGHPEGPSVPGSQAECQS